MGSARFISKTRASPKMSKMKKSKSSAVDVQPEDGAPEEKQLNENDTHEIQDFISQLGLDKFTPEVLSQLTSKTEKKLKKSAKAKVAINDDEEIPTLVPITKSKQKSTTVAKKVPKKKIVSDETGTLSYTNKEASINLNQPKQNKKVVFDEAGNPHTKKKKNFFKKSRKTKKKKKKKKKKKS